MNNLKKIRGLHELTQDDLAHILGVSRTTIANIETNKIRLSPRLALKASSALNENVFNLLGDDVFVLKPLSYQDKEFIRQWIR